jgi:spore maturation protein CgeB
LSSRDKLRHYVRGGCTTNATTAALYRRAQIGLNLYRASKGFGRHAPRIAPASAESLSPRGYELAACGVFHLSESRAEVAEVFGPLVPTFRSSAEASDSIRSWLPDAVGRAKVAAHLPATVAESSWLQRAAQVKSEIAALVEQRSAARVA